MPHAQSPTPQVNMIEKLSLEPSGNAPSQAEISSIMDTVFSASTSASSVDAAYSLCTILNDTVGYKGLEDYLILAEIKKAAANKKSGSIREGAQNLLGALFERLPPTQPISEVAFLLKDGGMLKCALDALSDKGAVVRDAAQYAIDALFVHLSSEALVVGLMPAITAYLSAKSNKWQGTTAAFKLLQKMADKSKLEAGTTKEEANNRDVLREAMGIKLAGLIPLVEAGMHDLKSEVEKQSVATMNSSTLR